ncbi:MAG: NADH-quinone oxidoreductase subunit NuoN [Hyphomonadaceae bacterium]
MSPVQDLLFSLSWAQSEALLAGLALVTAVLGAYLGDRWAQPLAWLAALGMVGAGVLALLYRPAEPLEIFSGALTVDAFGAFVKALMAFAAAATLLLGADYFAKGPDRRFEFAVLTLLSTLGFFVMAGANNLIALYIGLELQSLAAYVLAAFRRDDARSSEAGLKYFVLGALSSGILLYGASMIYGFAGSIEFSRIVESAHAGDVGVTFGLVFLICGLAFKLSAAPFHMWTPDVYEGAPTPVTALFASAPKFAAAALIIRVLYAPFGDMIADWSQVIQAIAALSLAVGTFAALVQTNIKRLMAYSSIANMGYVLMGIAAGGQAGAASALIYLAFYAPATIGAFAIILAMRRDGQLVERISDLAGLAARQPWRAVVLTVLFFSLAGIPPLAGFFGKFYVFKAALDAQLYALSILAALATVVGAGYYLWIIKTVWFDAPAPAFERASATIVAVATLATVLTFPVLVVMLGSFEAWANQAAAPF